MSDNQLTLIRAYCDTSGLHLSIYDKELLCKILEDPERYDGFTSELYTDETSGKDYRGRWDSVSNWQYRINIDTELSIDKRCKHECDGYVQDDHWDWDNAWHITDVREMLEILQEIEYEL